MGGECQRRFVKTDYDGCPYITAGKAYEVLVRHTAGVYEIEDDMGRNAVIDILSCGHLNDRGTWTECDAEGNEIAAIPLPAGVKGWMMEWQPIETAPKDGTEILVLTTKYNVVFQSHWDHGWEIRNEQFEYIGDISPSYWMPLPEPPK
jgi:hypothetical protein